MRETVPGHVLHSSMLPLPSRRILVSHNIEFTMGCTHTQTHTQKSRLVLYSLWRFYFYKGWEKERKGYRVTRPYHIQPAGGLPFLPLAQRGRRRSHRPPTTSAVSITQPNKRGIKNLVPGGVPAFCRHQRSPAGPAAGQQPQNTCRIHKWLSFHQPAFEWI